MMWLSTSVFLGVICLPCQALMAPIRMTATAPSQSKVAEGLMSRERYVASNRFKVRNGAAAKFEARWANRKSRLATLDGFRYFTLLRQVALAEVVGERGATAMGGKPPEYDYMSFTVWENKDAFQEWRNGDAFKEAHGGTSIAAFLSAMVSSLAVLTGPPSPAFYDGILHLSNPPSETDADRKVEGGWRVVEADGKNLLPGECFIAANRFSVREGAEAAFEERWSQRDSQLNQLPGFKSFTMLRRDSNAPDKFGDDFNYMSFTVWADKAAFMNWRNSQSFKDAHSPKKSSQSVSSDANDENKPQPPPWTRPPTVVFWEGILELSSPLGA